MWCICVPQGDGNIRYYELSTEKPYINFLTEYRSLLPQKGIGECSYTTLTLTLFTKVDTISFDLWRYFRSDAKARPGRERLWGFPILPSDCHQRPGRTTVDDRSTEGGLFYLLFLIMLHLHRTESARYRFTLSFQSGVFQEDLYPMTAGNQAAMTAQEWLSGINRGRWWTQMDDRCMHQFLSVIHQALCLRQALCLCPWSLGLE